MIAKTLRRIYSTEHMLRPDQRLGEIPGSKEAYSIAFAVAWASIAESFLMALITMADVIMVSAVGESAIAAVSLTFHLRFLLQTPVISLSVAITSIVARRRGEDDPQGAVSCLKQGLIIGSVISIIVYLICRPFTEQMLMLMGAEDDTIGMATQYFDIVMIGIPFSNLTFIILSALRGIGNTKTAMQVNIATNIVSVSLNYLLIGGNLGFPRLEVRGAAISTLIAWILGFILALISVARRGRFLHIFSQGGWIFDRRTMSAMWKVSSGSLLEQGCMRLGFMTFARIVAGLGTMMFAAHHIFLSLLSLSFSFGEGLGIAAAALVGRNLGAKRSDLSLIYGNICQRMSLITSAMLFLILGIWGADLLLLFTRDPDIIAISGPIFLIMCFILAAQASAMIFSGALRGAGDTKFTAVVSLFCIVILRPVAAVIFMYPLGLGLIGAWLGFTLDQYLRLFLCYRRFASGKWMSIKL